MDWTTRLSHVKPNDTEFRSEGLRDFFLYRDLGVAEATNGKVIAQLVKANMASEYGTGWHYHEAEFHIVYMLSGWAKFLYSDAMNKNNPNGETLVSKGDCVHQRPGIKHFLYDYSPDMMFLEIAGPAKFTSIPVEGPCEVPHPQPWTNSVVTEQDAKEQLWQACKEWIQNNRVSCPESLHQMDNVIENFPELGEIVCDHVGYYKE